MFLFLFCITICIPKKLWCRLEELNPQPTDYDSVALPIELSRHKNYFLSEYNKSLSIAQGKK